MVQADDRTLMRVALDLARRGPVPDANPRVGAVVVDRDGLVIGAGFHRGAGSPHAEIVALAAAGTRARGSTVIVTLEPCNHAGRTAPCTQALIDAGVERVVYAQDDPHRRPLVERTSCGRPAYGSKVA